MKAIRIYGPGIPYTTLEVMISHQVWLDTLPLMRGSKAMPYNYSSLSTVIYFRRKSDATAFRLKFGL